MSEREERRFADWLREGPVRGPADGPARVFEQTRTMRQRPAWSFPSRWTGDPWRGQRVALPLIIVLALLLFVAVIALVFVGTARPRAAPIIGPAGVGSLAWDTGTGGRVFIAGPDGSDPHPIVGAEPITRTPVFSPDGTKLAFWSRANTDQGTLVDLYAAEADGTNVHRINGERGLDINIFYGPVFSPNGSEVVFAATDGGVSRIYKTNVDGSERVVAITERDASRDNPAWSPDGNWIAFRETAANGTSAFSIMRPDGSGIRQLHRQPTADGAGNGPVWAPDSSAIAYVRPGDSNDPLEVPSHAYLAVQPLAGPERTLYKQVDGAISWPDWSPDGGWIAAGLGAEDPGSAILVRPDGSEIRTFAQGPAEGNECGVNFAPDARSVLVGCADFGRYELDDLQRSVPLSLPVGASGWTWQRAPLP